MIYYIDKTTGYFEAKDLPDAMAQYAKTYVDRLSKTGWRFKWKMVKSYPHLRGTTYEFQFSYHYDGIEKRVYKAWNTTIVTVHLDDRQEWIAANYPYKAQKKGRGILLWQHQKHKQKQTKDTRQRIKRR